jgi:hypothetical protein
MKRLKEEDRGRVMVEIRKRNETKGKRTREKRCDMSTGALGLGVQGGNKINKWRDVKGDDSTETLVQRWNALKAIRLLPRPFRQSRSMGIPLEKRFCRSHSLINYHSTIVERKQIGLLITR